MMTSPPQYSRCPPPSAAWRLEQRNDTDLAVVLAGDWDAAHAGQIAPETVFEEIRRRAAIRRILLAAKDLGRWDSVLMTFLIGLINRCRDEQLEVDTAELPDGIRALLDLAHAVPERAGAKRDAVRTSWLAEIGQSAQRLWADAQGFTRFLGEAALAFAALAFGRARFRRIDLWLYIRNAALRQCPSSLSSASSWG